MVKIVINKCYGGFGLSPEAMVELVKCGCKAIESSPASEWDRSGDQGEWLPLYDGFQKHRLFSSVIRRGNVVYGIDRNDASRTDADVVRVVEEMGEKANSVFAKLKVIEIPDGVQWEIDEYDGIETVREVHQSWG